jgi:hypothetical protein
MSQLANIFRLNRKGFDIERALVVLVLALVELIVLVKLGQEQYYWSAFFATLFIGLSDLGGSFGLRVGRMAFTGLIGALLTLIGFILGPGSWVLVTLAAFIVTLLGGLTVTYGLHRYVTGLLLNLWFVIALSLGSSYSLNHTSSSVWLQTLAWLAGAALWVVFVFILWLIRGRRDQPQPFMGIPAETAERPLTRPVIMFAILRALALAIAIAIPFGLQLPHADWMPIAALIAMKGDLQQSTLVGLQRIAGALIGAVLAAILLLTVENKLALEVVALILLTAGASIRYVNYALYCAGIAAGVLVALDLSNPNNLSAEGERVLFTLAGIGIGVLVMYIANLLGKRAAKASPQPTS